MSKFLNLVPREKIYEEYISRFKIKEEVEEIDVREAIGRVTAQNVISPQDHPGFDKSTVDGYAVKSKDVIGSSSENPSFLKVVGEVKMGEGLEIELKENEAVRIPTGGALPQGADAVVMIEDTREEKGIVEIYKSVMPYENVVKRDGDLKEGEVLIKKGEKITFAHVHALLTVGITRIAVYKKVKIGIISTGDEIIEPEDTWKKYLIRDGNTYTLNSWLKSLGFNSERIALIKDDFELLKEILKKEIENYDILVISGGSSVGVRDFTTRAVKEIGEVIFHGAMIKPGKPIVFGKVKEKPVIGLPGNPASFIASSYWFLIPLAKRIQGYNEYFPSPTFFVKAKNNIPGPKDGREAFVYVRLNYDKERKEILAIPIFGESVMIKLFLNTDGFVRIPLGKEGIYQGEMCEFYALKF